MRKFLQQHKQLLCMASIVCAVFFVFGMVRVFALPGLSLKVQTTKFNTVTDAFTPALAAGDSVAQSFSTDRPLYAVAVLPDLRACKGGATLYAVLTDAAGTPLARAQAELADTDAAEAAYAQLVLDTPVPMSAGARVAPVTADSTNTTRTVIGIGAHTSTPASAAALDALTLTLTVQPHKSGDTVRFHTSAQPQTHTGMGALTVHTSADRTLSGSLTLTAETGRVQGFITPFFIVLTLLCAAALCAVYAAVRIARWPLHRVYLVAVLCFGMLYLFVTPPYGATDEKQHISQAYNNASRILGTAPNQIPWGQSHRRVCDTNSTLEQNETTVFSYQELARGLLQAPFVAERATSTVVYEGEEVGGYQVPYALSTLGVLLGRSLQFGYVPTLLLGRLLNLALFAALTYLAVKHAPFGNAVFAAVGLLPGTLHVAASFSRDSFTLAVAFLFTALALRAAQRTALVGWREAAVLSGLCILLAPSKAAYVPMILLLLLLPAARFVKAWHAGAYRAATFAAAALLYWRVNSIIVWDAAMKSAENYEAAAAVNPDAITYSLGHIVTHLPQTLGLLVNTLVQNGTHYLNGLVGGTLGNDNLALSGTFVAVLFLLLVLAMQTGGGNGLLHPRAWRTAVPAWLGALGCCGLAVLGCVLWTPTYYTAIYGLQGRYFLPVLPLLLLLFDPRRAGNAPDAPPKGAHADNQRAVVGGGAQPACAPRATAQAAPACTLLLAVAGVQVCIILNIFYVVALR